MKTLYVTDLDGTLLNSECRVSDNSLQTINGLIDKGMSFSYATARAYESAKRVAGALKINAPVITYNGAFILNHKTGEVLSSNYFSANETVFIRSVLSKAGLYPMACSMNNGKEYISYLKGSANSRTLNYISIMRGYGDKRFKERPSLHEVYAGNVFYFKVLGEEKDFRETADKLNNDARFIAHISHSVYNGEPGCWFEIMPKKTSKANALKYVKKSGGYDKIICFGDGINDIEMFKFADEAYAVFNADEKLKIAATGIIKSCDCDGVAEWLKNAFNNVM